MKEDCMNKFPLVIVLVASLASGQVQLNTTNVSSGEIRGPIVWKSTLYPGTERNYWLYIPRLYDPAKPACVMVVQDGLSRATGWNLPAVLDSLIAARQIPVMIGIFIDHGKVPSSGNDNYPRFNRSLEYDALGDRYARFLLEEILPEVGRSYNLSANPNDRSIAGASSGAICAFNVAWERPDQFRRVLSTIGTYVGLRGGDEFATLVRKTEPKPLRVFLEDGNHDLNIYGGDWWAANQNMLSALTWSGYEVNHAWGEGGHDSKHAVMILADALTWLWKDYPAPVQTHKSLTPRLNPLREGEPWEEIPLKNAGINKLAVNKEGELFFTDKQIIYRTNNNGIATPYARLKGEAGGISFHVNGTLYAGDVRQNKIVAIDEKGVAQDAAANVHADFLTVSSKGVYFTETSNDRIGFYSFASKDIRYSAVPGGPTGLAISAEQTFLTVSVAKGVFGYSFKIHDDGHLDFGQEYIHYHLPFGATTPGTAGMTIDADNLLYSATAMGIQVSDQLGRVNFIISKPGGEPVDVKLGGAGLATLYVSSNGKLFTRKVNAKGVLSFRPAVRPSKPGM